MNYKTLVEGLFKPFGKRKETTVTEDQRVVEVHGARLR